MKQGKLYLGLLVVLVSGLIIGFGCGRWFSHRQFRKYSELGGEKHAEMMLGRLTHRLDLDPEQRDAIAPVVRGMAERILEVRKEDRLKVESIVQEDFSQIESKLRPEQLERWNEMRSRIGQALERDHPHSGQGHGLLKSPFRYMERRHSPDLPDQSAQSALSDGNPAVPAAEPPSSNTGAP